MTDESAVSDNEPAETFAGWKGFGFGIIFVLLLLWWGVMYVRPDLLRPGMGVTSSVNIAVRPSEIGAGPVLQIINPSNGNRLQGVSVEIRRRDNSSSRKVYIGEMPTGQVNEFGWMQWDWVVQSGDVVSVHVDGYADTTRTLP